VSKKKKAPADDAEVKPAPVPKVGTSMKGLLASVKLDASKPAPKQAPQLGKPRPPSKVVTPAAPTAAMQTLARPSDTLRGHERTAFYDAMAGVRGLGARAGSPPPRATAMKLPPAPTAPREREGDRDARAKLAALVSGGLRFEIRREDEWQAGVRHDAPRGTLENLASATPAGDAALDLHGARAADVETRVAKFVSRAHASGLRRLRIVHGKGLHSDAGGPVLGEAVIDALTKGAAAGRVLAFVTAPEAQGGSGALLVELAR
jgi:DNA-nicking Smr family endonuclease